MPYLPVFFPLPSRKRSSTPCSRCWSWALGSTRWVLTVLQVNENSIRLPKAYGNTWKSAFKQGLCQAVQWQAGTSVFRHLISSLFFFFPPLHLVVLIDASVSLFHWLQALGDGWLQGVLFFFFFEDWQLIEVRIAHSSIFRGTCQRVSLPAWCTFCEHCKFILRPLVLDSYFFENAIQWQDKCSSNFH